MPFPIGIAALEDSKYWNETPGDASISKEVDGGLYVSRRRFTRKAPRDMTTGFTAMSDSDYRALMAFYESVGGGADSWTYTHPLTGEAITVTFVGTIAAQYAGIGSSKMWNVTQIKLRTV